MKVAIMQPYFYPYIGYFQLLNAVDQFVVYDDIEYVKQSWINRNRVLVNGQPSYISLPLKKGSDYLLVRERVLADSWSKDRKKLLQRLSGFYKKSPYFEQVYRVIKNGLEVDENNLFDFLIENLSAVMDYLGIKTPLIKSSSIGDFTKLKSQEKVLAICEELNATEYLNPIGGVDLYDKSHFRERDITLHFTKAKDIIYEQFKGEFVPFLSIIDVLMFNDKNVVQEMISNEFELL